ncbi:alkaline phosphatase family protein [Reichenbachiella sp. MALMAid0571]|uniref:alkaline phosphatase family protein n=1 Tax=Reichenbachiella sp. MALMAid0571 TaxID=3143939 RepID=UPI0032DED9AE
MNKLTLLNLALCFILTSCHPPTEKQRIRTLVVFFDGLRPDYITPETMPNLYAFSKTGSYGKQHHSVFPTVTRVNGSSFSSGSYPATNGIMGNSVYFPSVDQKNGLSTGDYKNLFKISEATNGHLFTAISLGEILQQQGERMMVFSSGSTGQAMMQNHTVSDGAIINPDLILPEDFKETVLKEIGAIPEEDHPNTARHKWITDALIQYGFAEDGPLVSSIWFSDPDGTAHSDGIGAPSSMKSIQIVDAEFGRILSFLKEKNLLPFYNVIISADHGFVTDIGKVGLTDFLIEKGLKKSKESDDVIIVGGALYIKDHDPMVVQNIVSTLQAEDWVGPIFTAGKNKGDMKGSISGTLSFESIHWNHTERSADILLTENWNDNKNEHGYAGTSFARGIAGHGGISPYEVHIPLIAAGPSFKSKTESELPTSNVDITPTILAIHNIPIPASMDGRVINELLKGTKNQTESKKETLTTSAEYSGGTYTITLQRSILGSYQYVDYAKVVRVGK